MELKVRVTGTGPLLVGKAPEVIQRNQEAMITEMVMFLLPKIKAATPVGVFGDAGGLRGSEQADFQGRGTTAFRGIIGTDSPYGDVRERGRQAGRPMPPKGSLVRWLEVKMGIDEKTAQRIEFVVRRKIGQKGFQGALMFETTLDACFPQLQEIAARYGITIARELTGE